jgi:glycine/D-amino acid oxidase-like deaminating enzyme
MLLGKSILWIGLPETPPSLVPCMSADLTGVYADAGSADTLFLPLTKQGMGARELKQKLSAFVGPFDAIVLSSGFLDAQGYMLPAIKTVLLKLCHHLSLVIVERACNDEGAEKVLIELTKVLTLSLPGLPVGRTLKVADEQSLAYRHTPNARSTVEDRLRQRWGGLTTRTSNVHNPKCIAILGGGIAGVTLALELLKRGHRVELFEANSQVLGEGSAQPLLATYPQFSKDSDHLSILTQYSLQLLDRSPYAHLLNRCGRFQSAATAMKAVEQKALVDQLGLPQTLVQFLGARQAQEVWRDLDETFFNQKSGQNTKPPERYGGLWIPLGVQLRVALLKEYFMHRVEQNPKLLALHLRCRADLASLSQRFDSVVLATGQGTPALMSQSPAKENPLPKAAWKVYSGCSVTVDISKPGDSLRDTSSVGATQASSTQKQQAILGGPVSLQALEERQWLLGSSYFDTCSATPSDDAQWMQLIDGARKLTGYPLLSFTKVTMHPGARCSVRDRMPMIGPLPTHFGDRLTEPVQRGALIDDASQHESSVGAQFYLATAFGSRGLLWAHLAAQLISDHIDGNSPRIGLKALKSIDALRYAERPQSAFDE